MVKKHAAVCRADLQTDEQVKHAAICRADLLDRWELRAGGKEEEQDEKEKCGVMGEGGGRKNLQC